jgi:hypothetical protein
MGMTYRRVEASFIHWIRSRMWGSGQDQSFYARVECICLKFHCGHPCPSMRLAMQCCDRGPVWFGTRGVGLSRLQLLAYSGACRGRLGTIPTGPLAFAEGGCRRVLTRLRFCPVYIPRLLDPGAFRSELYGDHWICRYGPGQASGL